MLARYALAAALLVACAPSVASGGGTAPTGDAGPAANVWTARGDAACRVPAEAPPCPSSLDAPHGVAVWLNGSVVPLREALSTMVLPGVAQGELLNCDLSRLPLPRTCMVPTTCEGADVVIVASYLRGIAAQYVAGGYRCW